MRTWLEVVNPPFKNSEGLYYDQTPSYIYVINPFEMNGKHAEYSFYIMAPGDNLFVVAACWGHRFDPILKIIGDPKNGGMGTVKQYGKMWPTFGQLFDHSLNEIYSGGALLRFRDPDDAEFKWFVAIVVGNILVTDAESLIGHPRINSAAEEVFRLSWQLDREFVTHKISATDRAQFFGRGFLIGAKEGLAWERKIFKALNWLGTGG